MVTSHMQLTDFLKESLTRHHVDAVSKKRLLRIVSEMVAEQHEELGVDAIFHGLIQREKLGSTGVGNGVAIPHCRVSGCQHMIGVLMTLADPIDYDAVDGQPVDLVFVLIVPEESHQMHLDCLSEIAQLLNRSSTLQTLRATDSSQSLYSRVTAAASPVEDGLPQEN